MADLWVVTAVQNNVGTPIQLRFTDKARAEAAYRVCLGDGESSFQPAEVEDDYGQRRMLVPSQIVTCWCQDVAQEVEFNIQLAVINARAQETVQTRARAAPSIMRSGASIHFNG